VTALPVPARRSRIASHSALLTFLVIAAVVALGVQAFVAEPFRIPSASMAPTLHAGDHVVVDKLAFRIGDAHRGQIAVLREPGSGDLVLKRIVAVGGDVVGIEDGELVVNRRHPAEPYADPASIDSEYFGPVTVPAGAVFVLGDNRANSVDSRDFGVVPVTNLVGRVRARIWPASRWGVAS
jgi:signal peptidase I